MRIKLTLLLVLVTVAVFPLGARAATAAENEARLSELDQFWAQISRAVGEGDFEAYRATCHADGVLVSGSSKKSIPLAKAVAGWKQGFADTKAGTIKAGVQFKFTQRWGDATTAHETGIFRYFTIKADGQLKEEFVHFEVLLVKKGTWQTLMEYQKSTASKAEWDAIP